MYNNNYNNNRSNNNRKNFSPKPENKAKYNPQNVQAKGSSNSKYSLNNYTPKSNIPANRKGNSTKSGVSTQNKSNRFFEAMEKVVNSCYSFRLTENGAVGHSTSGSALLDMNFKLSSYRHESEEKIERDFIKAFNENPIYALKELFYFRDVRGGQGERRFFRVCITSLAKNGQTTLIKHLLPLMAEYGRWDDILVLLSTPSKNNALKLISTQWNEDMDNLSKNKPVSLLAKWLPSCQASSENSKKNAIIINKYLKLSPRNYRRGLSTLREHIRVVERQMSSQNWEAIDYEAVPSKANLVYANAFLRHDEERRTAYLEALKTGEAKINSSVSFPHEIVHKYSYNLYRGVDDTLEAMWKALPNLVPKGTNTIVVADGSASMTCRVDPKGNTSALEVANALAIYFAERAVGGFHNQYITFSTRPRLVNLNGANLKDNLKIAYSHNEVADTNIEATYDLILNTAIRNHMSQSELPANILIISDMEFNSAVCTNDSRGYSAWNCRGNFNSNMKTLFDTIKEKYANAGYKMPKTIFWNVNSRSNTIPMVENELGCILVSGFSVNTLKMVMSNKTDPYEALIEVLDAERYNQVELAATKAFEEQSKLLTKAGYRGNDVRSNRSNTQNSTSTNGKRVRSNIGAYKSRA